nr:MAG: hypothetical protein DIU61_17945 [Bacteroidota bacterium]
MQTTGLQYKLIKKIKDERFDEENLHLYNLLIHIGLRDLQVAVVGAAEQRLLWLEDYVLPGVQQHKDLMSVLDLIFDSHELLKAGFWNQVKVSVKNAKFVQVPDTLFIADAAADYLGFNAAMDTAREDVLYVNNPRAEAKTVFAIQRDLKEWITRVYPSRQPVFLHQSACLIESVMDYASSRQDNPLYIFIDRFKLHILSCANDRLVFYNHFELKNFPAF